MTWFNTIKRLTPEERRQTFDFWPKENKGIMSGYRDWPKERQAAYIRIKRRHKREGKPTPTLEDLEEELKNPIILLPKGRPKGWKHPHKGKKNINGVDTRPFAIKNRRKKDD